MGAGAGAAGADALGGVDVWHCEYEYDGVLLQSKHFAGSDSAVAECDGLVSFGAADAANSVAVDDSRFAELLSQEQQQKIHCHA